ncbi:uncharacterized protein LOC122257191 [Penaeus japonicus]|uniref:uncharacterized protein LOC122257191 n=1 Tax=Penaeus japonicus TaxID=27405 RepID=UPI001C70CC89|nr:uncharacterized protein LOC122257191 [Penaeus japonicus]
MTSLFKRIRDVFPKLRADTQQTGNETRPETETQGTERSASCWCGSLRNRAIVGGVLISLKSLASLSLGVVYGVKGYPEAWAAFGTGSITLFVFTPILFYGIWKECRKWLGIWLAWIAILTALGLVGSAVGMIRSNYVPTLAIVGVLFNFTWMVLLSYFIYAYMQSLRSREPLVEEDYNL